MRIKETKIINHPMLGEVWCCKITLPNGYTVTEHGETKKKAEHYANEEASDIVTDHLYAPNNKNPVSELYEFWQKRSNVAIIATCVSKKGEAHAPVIKMRVSLPDGTSFEGIGASKQQAKERACAAALSGTERAAKLADLIKK